MTFLYKADPARGEQWARLFAQKAPELAFRLWPDLGDPAAIRYLAAWQPPEDLARTLPNLEVVFSVGAGIDQFDLSGVPAHVPVVRMIEPGIVEGMVEYVTQAVLTIHRDLFDYALAAATARVARDAGARGGVAARRRARARRAGHGRAGTAAALRLSVRGMEPLAAHARWRRVLCGRRIARCVSRAHRRAHLPAAAHRCDARPARTRSSSRRCREGASLDATSGAARN